MKFKILTYQYFDSRIFEYQVTGTNMESCELFQSMLKWNEKIKQIGDEFVSHVKKQQPSIGEIEITQSRNENTSISINLDNWECGVCFDSWFDELTTKYEIEVID